jgi:ribosomal protein L37AE/L43A
MKTLNRHVKRLDRQFGSRQTCPVCGKPLDEKRLRQQNQMFRVVVMDEPVSPQCPRSGKPRIIRITTPLWRSGSAVP